MDYIDNAKYESNLAKIKSFWDGEGRVMFSLNTSEYNYRQNFDHDEICRLAPLNIAAVDKMPGCNMPCFFPDFGTVSTAKYWGGKTFFPHDDSHDIFIEPVAKSVDEAMNITPKAVDAPDMDAAIAINMYKQVSAAMKTDKLWLRTPDFQGTLNTASLIMDQEEMMMAMYTEPEKLHQLLDQICNFLIDYFNYLKRESGNRVCGNIWPYTFFPSDLGASFTEDFMPLISAAEYKEFGLPYVERMSEAFGAVHIHCCGDWGRHAENLYNSKAKIKAAEFHYPCTRIEEIEILNENTVFIPYIILDHQDNKEFSSTIEYYDHLLTNSSPQTRFWFPFCDPTEEAIAFAKKLGF